MIYAKAKEIHNSGVTESLERNLGRLWPPYGPPVGLPKQPTESKLRVAILDTEEVVDVVIDGLLLNEEGDVEEIIKR